MLNVATQVYTVGPSAQSDLSQPDPSPADALRALAANVILGDIWVIEKDGTRRRMTAAEEDRHRLFVVSKVGSGCAPEQEEMVVGDPSGRENLPGRAELVIYEDPTAPVVRMTGIRIPIVHGCAILDNRRVLLGEL